MRVARHIRRTIIGAAAAMSLLIVVFAVQNALAQEPEGPLLPEPGSEDAPGDIGYGREWPAVFGEQEDCEIDPGDPRCPPPAPYSIARPVVSYTSTSVNLTSSFTRVTWGTNTQHYYKFELHRSMTTTGTFTLHRSTWDGKSPVTFNGVTRGYYYKLRAKRCRVWRSETDCGEFGRFSPSVYVPSIATGLTLTRNVLKLTASYTAVGTTWDDIDVYVKGIGTSGTGTEVDTGINANGQTWTATRGNQYRFHVRRCKTSGRTECDQWSSWSPWVAVPNLPELASGLTLSRRVLRVTASFSASGAGYNRIELAERETDNTDDVDVDKVNPSGTRHTFTGSRGDEYRFRVSRCLDSQRKECGDWTSWTSWFEVPEFPSDAYDLDWTRAGTTLTYSFKITGDPKQTKVEIEGWVPDATEFSTTATPDLSTQSGSVSGTRGLRYRFRVARCTDAARTDCAGADDRSSWSRWQLVPKLPRLATSLDLTRSRTTLTATYSASGASYDVVNIFGHKIGDSTEEYTSTANLASSSRASRSHVKAVDRDYQYKFKVRRCTDAAHSDCGSWVTWTGNWLKVPQLPGKPPTPKLSRVKNNLTFSFTVTDASNANHPQKYDIERAGANSGSFGSYRNSMANDRKLQGVHRNYRYRLSVSYCTDAGLTDCGTASNWSNTLLVPNLPSDPGTPTLEVNDDDLTVTYTATGEANDQLQFQNSKYQTKDFSPYTEGALNGKVLSDVERNKYYKVQVRRCTDAAFTDCTELSRESNVVKVAAAPVQAKPTLASRADGKSAVASFALLAGFDYTLQLQSKSTASGAKWAPVGSSATLADGATSRTYTGMAGGTSLDYRVRLSACPESTSNNCVNHDSTSITLSKAPAPKNPGLTLANQNDLTVVYTVVAWANGTGDHYDFEIKRAETAAGSFSDYDDATTPSTTPHVFNNVHTGYYYKAQVRRCSDKAATICGDWSVLSSAVNVPALAAPPKPLNVRVSIVSHTEVKAEFTHSTWPGRDVEPRYVFQVGKSATENGEYVYSDEEDVDAATSVSFDELETGKWYKVRGKRCYSPPRKRCGTWVESPTAVETVAPNPQIQVSDFSAAITIGGGLSKSLTVTASRLDQTKAFVIQVRTSTSDVLKLSKCDASGRLNARDLSVTAGAGSSGPVSIDIYGCGVGTDTLTVKLKEGINAGPSVSQRITVQPVPVPTNVRANGHNLGRRGQIGLFWTVTESVTSHEFRLGDPDLEKDGIPEPHKDDGEDYYWIQQGKLQDSILVTGYQDDIDKLYSVQFRANRNGVTSKWSKVVYAYLTNEPPKWSDGKPPVVAGLRLRAYQTDRTYSYTFCANTIPETTGRPAETSALRSQWAADIKEGADAWGAAVRWRDSNGGSRDIAFVQVEGTTVHNCDLTREPGELTRPEIRLASGDRELDMACGKIDLEACVQRYPVPSSDGALGP